MIDYAYLTTLPSLAWIRKNPRQWDFFCWLLNQADEDGYALVSVREYATLKGVPWTTMRDWLKSPNLRPIIEATKMGKYTLAFFCNYASYTKTDAQSSPNYRPKIAQSSPNVRAMSEKTKEKENFPHTPLKDKENNVGCYVASLQEQQQQAAGANFSASVEVERAGAPKPQLPPRTAAQVEVAPKPQLPPRSAVQVEVAPKPQLPPRTAAQVEVAPKPQLPPRTAVQVEDARGRFWAQCCDVHSHHRDWPAEAVKSFFLYWTQWNAEQRKFKFELEDSWGTGYRMHWYIRRGHWLDQVQQAKLEQIKNGGARGRKNSTPTTADIKQKELALRIEQEEHDRRAQATITMLENARSHEDAKSDFRYWEGLGLDNPDTLERAKEKPEWLAAYNLALQKRDEKKAQ